MILLRATLGPFRSINERQTLAIDPKVTVLVGMNEAGKTVALKAMEKCRDVLGTEKFDPTDDFPRKDLSSYLRRHATEPAVAASLTYLLAEDDAKAIHDVFGLTLLKAGAELTVEHKYDNTLLLRMPAINEADVAISLLKTFSVTAQEKAGATKTLRELADLLAGAEITEEDKTKLAALQARIKATGWANVSSWESWKILEKRVPPFLYFGEYDILPGKLNLLDLANRVEQAKSNPKALEPKHRAVMALLRMADVTPGDFTGTVPYEQLKAKIEAVSISLTDQVMEFWKQNEDLEVEVDVKPDPTDVAPFNAGPNLYLRIKNRRHRGVSTSFDQRSRGFIWFFSFLVWFDSVRHQLDPAAAARHQNLVLLLDEPGLALHALAQADFLRYIDRLASDHQVVYTTHSPFMVHSERLHQIRLIEDRDRIGTVVTEVDAGGDARTLFPLQAALGWTIAQNLFISERNLLVEGPAELIYLQLASDLVEAAGRKGLRSDITIVPVGGLDKVVTFIALLGANNLRMAVLHDHSGKPQQKLDDMVRHRLLAQKALFNASQFRDVNNLGKTGAATDIEDLFEPELYLAYFMRALGDQLGAKGKVNEADLPPGDRIVQRIEQFLSQNGIALRPSGGFNHYTVAAQFGRHPPSLGAVGDDTIKRFAALFEAVNAAFD